MPLPCTLQCTEFKRTGWWVTSDKDGSRWLGVSPDGIVDNDTVVEIKCPYMEGNPFPYRKVPIFYIPQCQLEMYATKTTKCHFVCWTPKRTLVYFTERDEFIQELLVYLKSFWSEAVAGRITTVNEELDRLKRSAQDISNHPKLLKSINSCRKEQATEHPDFNRFWKQNEPLPKRKCVGCGKLQVLCKLNPCQQHSKSMQHQPLQSFQSFTYGSGQISNSCHTDTFLKSIYHAFVQQISPSTANFADTSAAIKMPS